MAMETKTTSTSAPPGPSQQDKKNQNVSAPSAAPSAAPAAIAAPAPAKSGKPTAAELKAKKQAEKAARRAQVVAGKAANDVAAPAHASVGGDNKGGKQNKPKQDGPAASEPATLGRPGAQRRQSVGKQNVPPASAVAPAPAKETDSTIPECFNHLPVAKRIPLSETDKDVHPAVLAVGQQMATFVLRDSVARLEASMLAFKKVIESYASPPGHVLTRHFLPHVLNPQIEYLTACRPMCFAMGNGIRLLKSRVTKLDVDLPEEDAKQELCDAIDFFLQERVALASYLVAKNAAEMIEDDDVILTYGNPRLVRKAIQQALADGRKFEVAIVDDPYDRDGQELAKSLRQDGIRVYYHPNLAGLTANVKAATKVMLGAEAMFSNGSLYGPAGTCDVAMTATQERIPVIALCETVNCDRDRVAVESLTYNEIDPERQTGESFRLLFDTTRDRYASHVVTEYEAGTGDTPARSIQSIIRKQEDPTN